MTKKTFTYLDFNGEKVTDTCYFNLTKAELADLTISNESLRTKLSRISESQNKYEILSLIKEIILLAYGEKSADGKHFMKSPEIRAAFECSEPYNMLYMQMFEHPEEMQNFVRQILPSDLMAEVDKKNVDVPDRPIGIE